MEQLRVPCTKRGEGFCFFDCNIFSFDWINLSWYKVRAISRIWIQLPFFSISYLRNQGQCLGMKLPDNLRKRVAFVTGLEERSKSCGGVQAKPCKAFNSAVFKLFRQDIHRKNAVRIFWGLFLTVHVPLKQWWGTSGCGTA